SQTTSWLLYKTAANQLYFHLRPVGDIVSGFLNGENFSADAWHHIAVVWDSHAPISPNSYATIYLNGQRLASRATQFPTTEWGNLKIGDRLDADAPARASIAQTTLWDRPLTTGELELVYSAGHEIAPPVDSSLKF